MHTAYGELAKVCRDISVLGEMDELNCLEQIQADIEACDAMVEAYLESRQGEPPSEGSVSSGWVGEYTRKWLMDTRSGGDSRSSADDSEKNGDVSGQLIPPKIRVGKVTDIDDMISLNNLENGGASEISGPPEHGGEAAKAQVEVAASEEHLLEQHYRSTGARLRIDLGDGPNELPAGITSGGGPPVQQEWNLPNGVDSSMGARWDDAWNEYGILEDVEILNGAGRSRAASESLSREFWGPGTKESLRFS